MTALQALLAGERAEQAGEYAAAAAAYRAVSADADPLTSAEAYFRLGRVSWRQSRFDAALDAFEAARALAERAASREVQARAANGIGAVHYARGDYLRARQAYAEAEALTGDGAMLGKIVLNLGVIANIEGDLETARNHYERAYRLFRDHDDRASAMLALHNRGMVEADLEQWDDADRSFLAALAIAAADGNVEMTARTLVNRSEVLCARGAVEEAVGHCDRALVAYATVGDEVGRGEALRWRAHALRKLGDAGVAERNATEALQIAASCGAKLLEAEAARELGHIKGEQGDAEGATRMLGRALALFRELGSRREVVELESMLG